MTQPFTSYQNALADKIGSTPPEGLIVMLYEGMQTRIKQAKERFAAQQPTAAREALIRAMKIADAMMDNLNFETGGETAKNLERLYAYIISELSEATRSDDPTPMLDNTLKVIAPLLEGWRGLAEKK